MSEVRSFNARSLTLSVLLGLADPRLSPAALARLADLFGVAAGTQRTALSRMVASGELRLDDGSYVLAGRHLERKSAQDTGRTPPPARWDGAWWVVAVRAPARTIAERREFRTHMINARMGELRPETWLRPANTAAPVAPGAAVVRGPMTGADDAELVDQLWDLAATADRARTISSELDGHARRLEQEGEPALADSMLAAATAVRFLREEPYLPATLAPAGWPVDPLRHQHREFDRQFGRVLRRAIGATDRT